MKKNKKEEKTEKSNNKMLMNANEVLKIFNKKNPQLMKFKENQSSSEDCSVESDILTNEFTNKVDLNDGNSEDELTTERYSRETNIQTTTSKVMVKPQQQQQKYTITHNKFIDEFEYRMNHKYRGIAIIINNKRFHNHLEMPTRSGTDKDAVGLEKTFHKLGFDVQLEHNLTAYEMQNVLNKMAKSDHSENDCFVCCILSHGEEGIIYGVDRDVEIQQLISPFKLCRSLAGKPKLFFIQACRGNKLMDSIGLDTNPFKSTYVDRIPVEADFLIAYSTVAGHYSWRNSTNGSWFIQSLCDVLGEQGTRLEMMQMLTIVNRKVAYHFESHADCASMSGKKQIPCIVTMLTKELFFKPKHQLCSDI